MSDKPTSSPPQKRFIPLSKWPDFHPWPPLGGLRSLVFNAKERGFQKCFTRAGRRILIDESEFFQWLENQKETSGAK